MGFMDRDGLWIHLAVTWGHSLTHHLTSITLSIPMFYCSAVRVHLPLENAGGEGILPVGSIETCLNDCTLLSKSETSR